MSVHAPIVLKCSPVPSPRALLVLAALWLIGPSVAQAQPDASSNETHEAVRATIDDLFDGMRAGDSTAVRAVFHEQARLHTAVGPADTTAVRTMPVDAFVRAVGRPHDDVWDERIWNVEIRVDGPLASAWVPYAFYLGDELSHCGVNAVQLAETSNGWKIVSLIDTRRQQCSVPPHVRK